MIVRAFLGHHDNRSFDPTLPMWKRDSVLTLERDSLPSGLRTGLGKKRVHWRE
ncbi:uncharacterized protein SEPMUDRAFT_128840 [Sphaerulina musiva SO2202]|uniref:Uncharacterized protein n=1 Tax=Sphaerulina musiva (strain SO2202) TaxID=692275 RepID=M3C9K4_SPHMS|nr:uncharacterized protein SEPMUDRAFT_128840 [Sphaerulina musiva SO2202]EMF08505.1 hypothetical protein SEPMUDRAFT_128840 [Sphaerulina musiva SO2202]